MCHHAGPRSTACAGHWSSSTCLKFTSAKSALPPPSQPLLCLTRSKVITLALVRRKNLPSQAASLQHIFAFFRYRVKGRTNGLKKSNREQPKRSHVLPLGGRLL